jgi:hypothetical protein
MAQPSDLASLEASLKALKLLHKSNLRLIKGGGAGGAAGGPWPFSVERVIPAPPAAAAYDVGALRVRVTLLDADLAAAARTARVEARLEDDAGGVPRALAAALRARVEGRFRELASAAGASSLGAALGALGDWAQAHFVHLITLCPQLIDPYMVADAATDTSVRRYAFVADAPEAEDAEAANEGPAAPPPPPPPPPPAPPAVLAPRLAAELACARIRYRTLSATPNADGGASLSVEVTPLDPEWRDDASLPRALRLAGAVPGSYPDGAPPALQAQCGALHPRVAARISAALAAEAATLIGRPNALRMLLAFAADHAGRILHEAAARAAAPQQPQRSAASSGDDDDDGDDGDESDDDDEDAFRPSHAAVANAGGAAGASSSGSLSLRLSALEMGNLSVLEPAALTLVCRCARCGAAFEVSWRAPLSAPSPDDGGAAAGACAACASPWRLRVAPRLAHEGDPRVATLTPEGCTPLELLSADLLLGCADCGAAASLRAVAPQRTSERACGRCHARMSLRFDAAAFPAASASASAPLLRHRRRRHAGPRTVIDPDALDADAAIGGALSVRVAPGARGGLMLGAPLPSLGTCAHYAHSHRWLRFPCCGRLFPCDVCHELAPGGGERCAESGGAWCARMVCGFCSREQPASGADGRCVGCARRVAAAGGAPPGAAGARAGAHFWEGGAGCRDRSKLCRVRARALCLCCCFARANVRVCAPPAHVVRSCVLAPVAAAERQQEARGRKQDAQPKGIARGTEGSRRRGARRHRAAVTLLLTMMSASTSVCVRACRLRGSALVRRNEQTHVGRRGGPFAKGTTRVCAHRALLARPRGRSSGSAFPATPAQLGRAGPARDRGARLLRACDSRTRRRRRGVETVKERRKKQTCRRACWTPPRRRLCRCAAPAAARRAWRRRRWRAPAWHARPALRRAPAVQQPP